MASLRKMKRQAERKVRDAAKKAIKKEIREKEQIALMKKRKAEQLVKDTLGFNRFKIKGKQDG